MTRLFGQFLLIAGSMGLVVIAGGTSHSKAATNRFVAVGGNDTSNDCSNPASPCATIQHAINQSVSGDVIKLGPGTYFENVSVTQNVTIQGDANGSIVNGNHAATVFLINFGVTAKLSALTITNGTAESSPFEDNTGGGISNFVGTLTVTGCTITGNHAPNGTNEGGGGGIFNFGKLTVIESTISANSAGAFGGGIFNFVGSTASIVQSTISGNSAGIFGGGISNIGTASIVNSTITGNSAGLFGGGILNSTDTMTLVNSTISANQGGGIYNDEKTVLNLQNTIIAGSLGFRDCFSVSTISTNSHNLVRDGSCAPAISGDPKLGALNNNGGPTLTQALLSGSPAIDAGDDSVLGVPFNLTTDQRGPGFSRKFGPHVDIGALEAAFDTCLKDTTTGALLQWNSTDGSYKLTRCSDGFMLTGTGAVGLVNGLRTLADSKPDRRVSAGFNVSQRTGSATIYVLVAQGVWETLRISDTNPGSVCGCAN